MSDNRHFEQLVSAGQPVGEVIGVNRFLIDVSGLQPVSQNALVMFEDGSRGFVHHILEDRVTVLHLGQKSITVGMVVVVQQNELSVRVGEELIGRVVNVTGEPLDGKGPIAAGHSWPVFATAPALHLRELLDTQLETGVTLVDSLFPIVRGQRMAMLGDSKTGKTSLATQLALNQRNTDVIVIYVLIAKRRSDIDSLIDSLNRNNAMKSAIVVVATMSESPIVNYLAPYVGCSIAEYLWQEASKDVLIIYDDLTSHAHVYREISLLAGVSPGRDSYPGDIFFKHSSLLERAGKLAANHKTLTAVPIVFTPGGDITAYLSTNIMSITDGQWVLDMKVFHETVRPAINAGISVTRVGGSGHNQRQKQQARQIMESLAAYSQSQQFAHFGSEVAASIQTVLTRGKRLYEVFTQQVDETHNLMAQQLMLDIVLGLQKDENIDLSALKLVANEYAAKITKEDMYNSVREELKTRCIASAKTAPVSPPPTQAKVEAAP